MEKVQFQLEATLPELKDLYEKGLFSKDEIDQITRRRTHLETSLVRQGVKKEEFFKYAEYEINLEKLRKVRWKRLGYDKNPPPPSASLYSIPRRTMYILKRATVKFPGDLATWLAYVEYAGREGMRKVVTKGLTSALQHHPLSSTLYLLSSFHHVHPGAPFPRSAIPSASTSHLPSAAADRDVDDEEESKRGTFALEGTQAARTTLLLGLRMLPVDQDLWREYIKLELGWVEALRRRWKVLGIANTAKPKVVGEGGEGSFGPDGEDARKAILAGQLVLQAIRSALGAIPIPSGAASASIASGMNFRQILLETLRIYPSPLRGTCLEVVYENLERLAGGGGVAGARATLLLLTKELYDRPYEAGRKDDGQMVLSGVELVEALGRIGKEIRKTAKTAGPAFGETAGAWLDQQIGENKANTELTAYLTSILSGLAKPSLHPTPSVLLLHLSHAQSTSSPTEYHDLVSKYASLHPRDPSLQLALLRSSIDDASSPSSVRASAERLVKSFEQSVLSIEDEFIVRQMWTTWADSEASSSRPRPEVETAWTKILRLSLGSHASAEIHDDLLVRYFDWLVSDDTAPVMSALKRITGTYRPRPRFFAHVLDKLVEDGDMDTRDIMRLHEAWRAVCTRDSDKVDEGLAVAEILLLSGKAVDAVKVVETVKVAVREKASVLADLENRWKAMMDAMEAGSDDSEDDSGEESVKSEDEDKEGSREEGEPSEGSDEGAEDSGADLDVLMS